MKKLRVIVTSVVILTIVGGALSFKTKKYKFCIKTGTAAGDCTTYKQNFMITTVGGPNTDYRFYSTWDGEDEACTRNHNNKCQTQVKLISDGGGGGGKDVMPNAPLALYKIKSTAYSIPWLSSDYCPTNSKQAKPIRLNNARID